MPITITRVDREFSPSEAAAITGVSATLQRDWRRRGILPENHSGGWSKFSLMHVIQMAVMKSFSDAGFSIQYVAEFASMAVLPTLAAIDDLPGVVVFEGEEISDGMKERTIGSGVVGASGRFLVMMTDGKTGRPSISRWSTLDGIETQLAECSATHCTIMDCELLAGLIAERAGPPLIRFEVTNTPSK